MRQSVDRRAQISSCNSATAFRAVPRQRSCRDPARLPAARCNETVRPHVHPCTPPERICHVPTRRMAPIRTTRSSSATGTVGSGPRTRNRRVLLIRPERSRRSTTRRHRTPASRPSDDAGDCGWPAAQSSDSSRSELSATTRRIGGPHIRRRDLDGSIDDSGHGGHSPHDSDFDAGRDSPIGASYCDTPRRSRRNEEGHSKGVRGRIRRPPSLDIRRLGTTGLR